MANVDIYQMTTKDTNHKVAPVTIFDAVVNPLNKKTLDQEFEDMVGAVDENVALDNADETLVTTALRKTNQVLTLAEQTQARTNIGAASATDLTELSTTVSENKTETDGKLTELATQVIGKEIYNKDNIYITQSRPKNELITYNFEANKTYILNVNGQGVISSWLLLKADGTWQTVLPSNTSVNGEDVYFTPSTDLTNVFFSVAEGAALQTDSIGVVVKEKGSVLLDKDIVNNLTTGGEKKTLSAEQGKVLNTAIQGQDTSIQNIEKAIGIRSYTSKDWTVQQGVEKATSFAANIRKGKKYKVSYTESVSCLSSLVVMNSAYNKTLATVQSGETAEFFADKDYDTIGLVINAQTATDNGNITILIAESIFSSSEYIGNILSLEGEMGKVYQTTQTAAAIIGYRRTLDGKRGYVKISSSGRFEYANIVKSDSTNIPIDSTLKYVDLTEQTGTSIYISAEINSTISLEFIDYSVLSKNIFNFFEGVKGIFNISFTGYSSMIPIRVKKDGSGDFTTIQDAINSIKDASVVKQYDIQVYDDFEITDLTNLWLLDYPNTHVSANPANQCALVITKDYVNVRGMGRKKKLSIKSPKDLASASFQNIQVIIPQGNCIIKNFDVILEGGRYAIHQENFGLQSGINANATTIYEDLNVIHKGNAHYPNGSGWGASLAQANGTASGCKWIFRNCKWVATEQGTPIYMHLNQGFTEKSKIEFYNCSLVSYVPINLASAAKQSYILEAGSDVGADVIMVGNNFTGMDAFCFANIYGNEQTRSTDNIMDGEINYIGQANTKMVVNKRENPSLSFTTVADNVTINVTGGTAYDVLWGETYKAFGGTSASSNVKGICVGSRKIYDQPDTGKTSIFSLAYRLGNCASSPKTLIVNVGGTDYTLTFDQNYMTADGSNYSYNTTPRYTNAEIIAQINNMYPEVFVAKVGGWTELQTPTDCKKECRVFQNYNIEGNSVVGVFRTASYGSFNAIVPYDNANSDLILLGVLFESTNKREACSVAIADKSYFPMSILYPDTAPKGTLFKVVAGKLVITTTPSEAVFYAIDEATLSVVPGLKIE